jgi:hypothetical protein
VAPHDRLSIRAFASCLLISSQSRKSTLISPMLDEAGKVAAD